MTKQIEISLPAHPKGYHLITDYIEKQLIDLPQPGMVHEFIKHTSAVLS